MKKIALSILCSLVIAAGGFYWTVVKPALANVVCSLPFTLTNGTIADATQVMANYNALVTCLSNAAAAGANNDITSLSGLTTPITPNEGGSNVYIGASPTASGDELFIATTTPANYSNTRGYSVIFTAVATNTSIQTMSVNSQARVNVFKQSTAGPVPLSGGEIVPNQQYFAQYDGTQFQINPVPQLAVGFGLTQNATQTVFNTTNPPLGFGACNNMTINATVGSNLLGLQLFAADTGAAPTAIHPIFCNFTDPTQPNGDSKWASLTSATYMDTNAAGATLGTTNSLPFRLWLVLYYNGGTPKLGLWQSTSFTAGASPQAISLSLNTFDESALISPTAISAAASAAGTFYTSNGLSISASPFRILGYMDWSGGLATAGTYATGPTKIQLYGPGVRKPGERINYYVQTLATTLQTANSYTPSAQPPVPTNGVTIVSQTVTPTALMDIFRVNSSAMMWNGTNGVGESFITKADAFPAVGKTVAFGGGITSSTGSLASVLVPLQFSTIVTSASTTFVLYGTGQQANTFVNAVANGGVPNGTPASWLSVEEIQP